jgi:hypothetical protein
VALVRELPPLVGEVSATFAVRGCRVVSAADPYGRIIRFSIPEANSLRDVNSYSGELALAAASVPGVLQVGLSSSGIEPFFFFFLFAYPQM